MPPRRFSPLADNMLDTLLTLAAAAPPDLAEGAGTVSELAGKFGVNWKFVFAQAVNFCIVAYILHRFAFKPVLATIEERQQKIADGLQYAEEMKTKLAETGRARAETLNQAREEARKIVQQARDNASAHMDKQTREAAEKAEDMLQKGRAENERQRRQMLSDVRQEVARLVAQTAAKVLRKQLSEEEKTNISRSAAKEIASLN